MSDSYSLYEAKARLSALVRMVREGRSIVITVHGRPAAELRPYQQAVTDTQTRFKQLEERGIIVPASRNPKRLAPVAKRPGALKRFLAERD